MAIDTCFKLFCVHNQQKSGCHLLLLLLMVFDVFAQTLDAKQNQTNQVWLNVVVSIR